MDENTKIHPYKAHKNNWYDELRVLIEPRIDEKKRIAK